MADYTIKSVVDIEDTVHLKLYVKLKIILCYDV